MIKDRIIFMGTPEIATFYLDALIKKNYNIKAIFTQPPRKKGRGLVEQQTPVHKLASLNDINVFTPKNLNDEKIKKIILDLNPDLIIVMAYGLKIPNFILNLPKFGCINIHVSLLPRWRGAAPIEHALLNGDLETGITIFKIEEEIDSGPIITTKLVKIDKDINKIELIDKLNQSGVKLLISVIPDIINKKITYKNQSSNNITYASKLSSESRKLDFYKDVEEVHNKIRAFSPDPAAWFICNDQRIKIIKANFLRGNWIPSTILNKQFHIGCKNGKIYPEIIQREGKKPMLLNDFLKGFDFKIGYEINE